MCVCVCVGVLVRKGKHMGERRKNGGGGGGGPKTTKTSPGHQTAPL